MVVVGGGGGGSRGGGGGGGGSVGFRFVDGVGWCWMIFFE